MLNVWVEFTVKRSGENSSKASNKFLENSQLFIIETVCCSTAIKCQNELHDITLKYVVKQCMMIFLRIFSDSILYR